MTNKKILLISSLSFIFINIAVFCIFYIPNFVIMDMSDSLYEVWRIVSAFATKLFDYLLPVAAATLLFIGFERMGIKKILLEALLLSLTRVFYIFPYFYLQFWINGNDSVEAVSLSLLVTLFGIAVFFGESFLLLYIIRTFARLPIIKGLKKDLPLNHQENTPKNIMKDLKKTADGIISSVSASRSVLDLDSPITFGILSASLVEFFISLLFELSDFVGYLVEYAGDYRTWEIVEFTSYLVFLAAELLLSHAICCTIFNFIKKSEDKK